MFCLRSTHLFKKASKNKLESHSVPNLDLREKFEKAVIKKGKRQHSLQISCSNILII